MHTQIFKIWKRDAIIFNLMVKQKLFYGLLGDINYIFEASFNLHLDLIVLSPITKWWL